MRIEIARPFEIGGIKATLLLTLHDRVGDPHVHELADAVVRDAVLAFIDGVLHSRPERTIL